MAGIPHGDFDERLTEALNGVLINGEEVVASEVGDQGQAIVLTMSRIIVLKVGLAAAGELNGSKASAFPLDTVSAVNLRKGPLGAVVQICCEAAEAAAQAGTPDNVVVFTGPGRVRKAEAFVMVVESVGKTVNRVEPAPAPTPKGGREPRSLADEIYSEAMQPRAEPTEAAAEELSTRSDEPPAPVVDVHIALDPDPAPVPEPEEEKAPDPRSEFNPNPRLPRPIRKRETGPNKVLVLLGVLAALMFVGMAVMAPMRDAQNEPVLTAKSADAAGSISSIRLQLSAVTAYHKAASAIVAKSDRDAASFRAAVTSGGKPAIQSASRSGVTDDACRALTALSAPPGLAEAKQNIMDGLLVRKNAMAAAAAEAGSAGSVDARSAVSQFDRAGAQIRKGLSAVTAAQMKLEKQVTEFLKKAPKRVK